MARSVDAAANDASVLGEIARLAEIAIFGTLSETLSHLWTSGLPLPGRRTQSMVRI